MSFRRLVQRLPAGCLGVLLALSVFTASCALVPRRTRITRALVVSGALVAVAGGVITAGCIKDDIPGACSAGPADGTARIGLPILAVGAAIITGALMTRPRAQRAPGPPVVRHAVGSGDPFGPAPNQGY